MARLRPRRAVALGLLLAALCLIAPTFASSAPRAAMPTPTTCTGADRSDRPIAAQQATMNCLINATRRANGLRPVRAVPKLAASARLKGARIASCRQFSHNPCGDALTKPFAAARYPGRSIAENLAAGQGTLATPWQMYSDWMASPGHRRNILNPSWTEGGVNLRHGVSIEGSGGWSVWTSHFGRP